MYNNLDTAFGLTLAILFLAGNGHIAAAFPAVQVTHVAASPVVTSIRTPLEAMTVIRAVQIPESTTINAVVTEAPVLDVAQHANKATFPYELRDEEVIDDVPLKRGTAITALTKYAHPVAKERRPRYWTSQYRRGTKSTEISVPSSTQAVDYEITATCWRRQCYSGETNNLERDQDSKTARAHYDEASANGDDMLPRQETSTLTTWDKRAKAYTANDAVEIETELQLVALDQGSTIPRAAGGHRSGEDFIFEPEMKRATTNRAIPDNFNTLWMRDVSGKEATRAKVRIPPSKGVIRDAYVAMEK